MDKNYTHVSIVLDKSGSMAPLQNDTIKGFNNFIEEQKKIPGKLTLSLLQFDTGNRWYYKFNDINDIKNLDQDYMPGGGTALYDAVVQTIDETGKTLREMPEAVRPSKVLLVIITDGEENSSKFYPGEIGRRQVKEKIEHQEKVYNWETVFMGSNLDVVAQAQYMGIRSASVLNYSSERLFGQLTPGEYVISSYSALGSGLACARNATELKTGQFFSEVGLTEDGVVNKV